MNARWTDAEIDQLESMIGNVASFDLQNKYNQWANANGYPTRTQRGIAHAVHRVGHPLWQQGDYVTTGYIAKTLGIPIYAPQQWIDNGHVAFRRKRKNGYAYISRADLRNLANRKPYLFAGCSCESLYILLENEDIAKHISQEFGDRTYRFVSINQQRSVRAIEINKIFPSVGKAAKAVFVRHQVISRAIQQKHRAGGYHWEYVQ